MGRAQLNIQKKKEKKGGEVALTRLAWPRSRRRRDLAIPRHGRRAGTGRGGAGGPRGRVALVRLGWAGASGPSRLGRPMWLLRSSQPAAASGRWLPSRTD